MGTVAWLLLLLRAAIAIRMQHQPNAVLWCDMSLSNYAKTKQTDDQSRPVRLGFPGPGGELLLNLGGMTQ